MDNKNIRLFIAANIPADITAQISLLLKDLQSLGLSAKWTPPENMHITLKFLGDTQKDKLDLIQNILETTLPEYSPIECTIDRLGLFPSPHSPRSLWLGFSQGQELLAHIASSLDEQLSQLEYKKETRKFTSHLTLARIKSQENKEKLHDYIEHFKNRLHKSFFIDTISLYQSTFTQQGSIYNPIVTQHLKRENL